MATARSDGRLSTRVTRGSGRGWVEKLSSEGLNPSTVRKAHLVLSLALNARRRIEVAEAIVEVHGKSVVGTPKSHQRRSVPVPHLLAEDLAKSPAGKGPDDLVFTSPQGGVLRNTNFRPPFFDPAAEQAGLRGLTPHELRHTAASLAVAAGANVKAVQQMLGHASAAMTLDVYAGLFADDLDQVPTASMRPSADCLRTRCGPNRLGRPSSSPRCLSTSRLKPRLTRGPLEPPVGFEPTTYALRERRMGATTDPRPALTRESSSTVCCLLEPSLDLLRTR